MKKRVYLFGIGSPEWQARTGHIVNARGVPIPVRPKLERCRDCGTPRGRNLGACSFGGYCTWEVR